MNFIKIKKKILVAALGFAAFMLLCTLLSRGIYAAGLPQVETQGTQKRALGHTVEAEGSIEAGSELAVDTIAGLKVDEIRVKPGETVSANTLLFTVNQDALAEKIAEQELTINKLTLEIEQIRQQQELADQKELLEQNRSLEDYALTDTEQDRKIDQAYDQTARAQEKLNDHLSDQPKVTSEEERAQKTREYEEWTAATKELQRKLLAAQEELEAAEAEAAAAQKALEEYEASDHGSGTVSGNSAEVQGEENNPSTGQDPSEDTSSGQSSDPEYLQLKEAVEQAQARLQEKQKRVNDLTRTIEEANLEAKTKPDYSAEDAEQENWEDTRKSLEDALEDAQTNQENSVWDKLDAMLAAKRKVEDAALAGQADLTRQINELELAYRKEILKKYKAVQEQKGCIYSQTEGVVTDICIASGEPAPEGACIRLARLDEAFRFRCTLTKEEKKYISLGDEVTLKLGNTGKAVNATVDYMTESTAAPGSFEAYAYLPEGAGSVGMNAVLVAAVQSQSYAQTLPASAVHEEEEQNYCYVLRKQQGILGEELAVTRTAIEVLDRNSKYVAVEEGTLDENAEVVIRSTKELGDGKVVRYGG